jgi:hypothetical protein
MFAILRGANGRRHEVDLHDDPVTVDVPMRATTIEIIMAAAGSSHLVPPRHCRPATQCASGRDRGCSGSSRS